MSFSCVAVPSAGIRGGALALFILYQHITVERRKHYPAGNAEVSGVEHFSCPATERSGFPPLKTTEGLYFFYSPGLTREQESPHKSPDHTARELGDLE